MSAGLHRVWSVWKERTPTTFYSSVALDWTLYPHWLINPMTNSSVTRFMMSEGKECKIPCITAPICTGFMDLSELISSQCRMLVYHCTFFQFVSLSKNELKQPVCSIEQQVSSSSAQTLISHSCFVVVVFLLLFFLFCFFVFQDHLYAPNHIQSVKRSEFFKCNVQLFQRYYCSKVRATCCAMTKMFWEVSNVRGFFCLFVFFVFFITISLRFN